MPKTRLIGGYDRTPPVAMRATLPGTPLELELSIHHPCMQSRGSAYYAVVAAVCLQRRHSSPKDIEVDLDGAVDMHRTVWRTPSADDIRSFANRDEATRDAAYCLALAAAHVRLEHVALRRSEGLSGTDWYLVPVGTEVSDDPDLDLERDDLVRLEVSGIDLDDPAKVHGRLREKVKQAREGKSLRPAYAAVVGFKGAIVRIAQV